MEIGNQIKALRQSRGVTQEIMAEALGVSGQAVSKWETGAAAPDIALLPELSAYFGVTIDELFALTDETRMKRIDNMLGSQREVEHGIMEREAAFLLEKARREPKNFRVWDLLAYLENHRGDAAKRRAAKYAKEALHCSGGSRGSWEFAQATGLQGPYWELADSHRAVIDDLKELIAVSPGEANLYEWLIDALVMDSRFEEALAVCDKYAEVGEATRCAFFRGTIIWKSGDREGALKIWNEMVKDLPEESEDWGLYAEGYAMTGDFLGAAEIIDRVKSHMVPPRATWAWEEGAYFRELAGDIPGAIARLEEFLEIRRTDYGNSGDAGEEWLRGEIERLKRKL